MPVLDETILEQSTLVDSHYGFSATRLEDLGASEYALVRIACDVSGSTALFISDIEQAITQVVQACRHSARADNLLLRLVSFDDTLKEIHGFKLLENCNLVNDGGVLTSGGSTALYDASVNSVSAISSYSRH